MTNYFNLERSGSLSCTTGSSDTVYDGGVLGSDPPPRMVVRMECSGLQCGRRPASLHGKVGRAAAKHGYICIFQVGVNEVGDEEEKEAVARHGDWPWHVALMKEVGEKSQTV